MVNTKIQDSDSLWQVRAEEDLEGGSWTSELMNGTVLLINLAGEYMGSLYYYSIYYICFIGIL